MHACTAGATEDTSGNEPVGARTQERSVQSFHHHRGHSASNDARPKGLRPHCIFLVPGFSGQDKTSQLIWTEVGLLTTGQEGGRNTYLRHGPQPRAPSASCWRMRLT